MISPDANLLIYALDPSSHFHRKSRTWLEEILSSFEPIGIPIYSINGFLRFVTNSKIAPNPIRFEVAAKIINSWLALPHVRILYPDNQHWLLLQQLSEQVRLSGASITDAAIAAIALEHGSIIHTNDRDFARFPGVRWHNPLKP